MNNMLLLRRRCMGSAEFEPLAAPVIRCGNDASYLNEDGIYCVGDVIRLHCDAVDGATYYWEGPTSSNPLGFHSSSRNSARGNCTMAMAGTYYCTITVGGQSATSQMEVGVQPFLYEWDEDAFKFRPYFDNRGDTYEYEWDFGDGTTSTQKEPRHAYESAGTYTVSLIVKNETGVLKSGSRTVEVG